jgi:hypothetical protein
MIAEGDTYQKYPDDETYPQLAVNYIRLDRVPKFDEEANLIRRAMQAGDFFVTTGEVLFRKWGVEGSGPQRVYTAEVKWTFPLEFVEVIWGDGNTTHRQRIPAPGLAPFGNHQFRIPFGRGESKWVRFADPSVVALAVISGIVVVGPLVGFCAGSHHKMALEQWTVGGRGFGVVLVRRPRSTSYGQSPIQSAARILYPSLSLEFPSPRRAC